MKTRRSEADSLIKLLIVSFKNNSNLPFTIPTMRCPDLPRSKKIKKKKCKKKHSEIVVESYNKEQNTFHLLYYGIHSPKVQFQHDQDEHVLFSMIKKSLTKRKYGLKTLIQVKDLKKILKTTKITRHNRIQVRFSDTEYLNIQSKSKRRNLDMSEYIRMELFS